MDTDVWVELNANLLTGIELRSAEHAAGLSQGSIGFIRHILHPLFAAREAAESESIPEDAIHLVENVALLACLSSKQSNAQTMRNTVKELLQVSELCLQLAGELDVDQVDSIQTLSRLSEICLIPLKDLYKELCDGEDYYCQSFVQILQSMALKSAHIVSRNAVSKELEAWRNVVDGALLKPEMRLMSEIIDSISTIIASSWHTYPLRAQQDMNFLEIVSGTKFVVLSVSYTVLKKLNGDEDFSRLVIPLLIDMMAVQAAQLEIANHVFAVHVLASIGVVCAENSNFWGFSTVLGTFIKLFKFPEHKIAAALLHGQTVTEGLVQGTSPGTLSKELLHLACGIKSAPISYRKFLRKKLLTLFSDFALLMPNDSYIVDLGSLLPAIACAISSIKASFVMGRISSALSSGDLSLEALNKLQEEGRLETSAFRHLWFCSAVYDFGSVRSSTRKWPDEWSESLYEIASRTPLLLIGSEQQQESVFLDHIGAEFGGWLSTFGTLAEPKSLFTYLRESLNSSMNTPVKPELCCHILTVAYIASCHAKVQEFSNSERSPIDHVIIHAQFSVPNSSEYCWYKEIIYLVFDKYLTRLLELKHSSDPRQESFAFDSAAYSASTMIESLVQQGPNDDIPQVMVKLLQMILPNFPSLYFSTETINGAIRAVATERESNLSAGSLPLVVDPRQATKGSTASNYLLEVIENAASRAPSVIEAIFGENLRHMSNVTGSSADITSIITPSVMESLQQGRSKCSLPDSMGVYKGVIAWSSKIRALGIIDGLKLGGISGKDIIRQQTRDLINKIQSKAPHNAVSDSILDLAASCISLGNEEEAKLPLQLLAWAPLSFLSESVMKTSCLAWHWILSSCPSMSPMLIENITAAWSSNQNLSSGVFDISPIDRDEEIPFQYQAMDVQRIWIVFWTELWRSSNERLYFTSFSLEASVLRIAESIQGDTDSSNLSKDPYSCSTRFRLLNLVLECLLTSRAIRRLKPGMDSMVASRYGEVVNAALAWFTAPPAWIETTVEASHESLKAVSDFGSLLNEMEDHLKLLRIKLVEKEKINLLSFLIHVEINRLKLWVRPMDSNGQVKTFLAKVNWCKIAETSWKESPKLALSIGMRFADVQPLQRALEDLVVQHAHEPTIQKLAEGIKYLAVAPASANKDRAIKFLSSWTPIGLEQSMSLMSMQISRDKAVFAYIIRCLELCDPKDVSFFLPQLVQLLRHDPDKGVESFLLKAASKSSYFAFLLKCQLLSEGTPPEEAFSPEVKRSNWSPPTDTGLWTISDTMYETVLNSLTGDIRDHLKAESAFFNDVTAVSGKLYPVPKDERKAAAVNFLSEIHVSRDDLFMPFSPDTIIKAIKPETAAPMQSAAKCPILVAFDIERREHDHRTPGVEAAIFKVGDDCRQDVLALQVVELVKRKFDQIGLPLPLIPYGVIPTGHECGIIQVVPKAKSRAQLGEITDGGLLDVFQHEFGLPGSARFEAARKNFIESSAAYAIVSYILQAKDRHNGNIMIDNTGKMIHIDFGYIFGISPGGNMGFESAAFKLSYEMTELIDPGNTRKSIHFLRFQELCVKGYLAARTMADSIVATVEMMMPSKLPCFSIGTPIESLRKRFHLEMSDQEAAHFMKSLINDAYDKWTTGVYDLIQYYQNKIPK